MKTTYWFINKRTSVGWKPATWQGWLISALYAITAAILILHTDDAVNNVQEPDVRFFTSFAAITFLLLMIVIRTGEPLQWRKSKKNSHE